MTTGRAHASCNVLLTFNDVHEFYQAPALITKPDMIEVLEQVKKLLPEFLRSEDGWRTLYIDYEPPLVERVWRQWGQYRIYLHKIHAISSSVKIGDAALFHPHQWGSGMEVISGEYEMGVGYGKGIEAPPIIERVLVKSGESYEMVDPDDWHYVRPLSGYTYTLMVAGPLWDRAMPGAAIPAKKLSPLMPYEKRAIMNYFRAYFPR